MAPSVPRPWSRRLSWTGLILLCLFDVWWRGHTIGPTIRDLVGFAPYPVVSGRAEPIDCDEAAYAYIGKKIDHGSVMYRDLSENKPPLGYWLYALTVAIGGATELTIRVMPLVFVLPTIALIWWVGVRLRGGLAATLASLIFALLSTDPFLYGNGANMEHFINLFGMMGLAALIRSWDEASPRARRGWIALAGASVALGFLVKQVAAIAGPVFALALLLATPLPGQSRWRRVATDWLALVGGFALPCLIAASILVAQGAGRDAWADVVEYGAALAAIKVPDPGAPPRLLRWFTGNADPLGNLPPPFGRADRLFGYGPTNYLVWWGGGSWPIWLASIPATAWLLGRRHGAGRDRIVAAWTLTAWLQVALPGLFWAHYYLLPTPGLALVIALVTGDAGLGTIRAIRAHRFGRGLVAGLASFTLIAAVGGLSFIQIHEYLLIPAEELTVRDKGGRQWVVLRDLGGELARRSAAWGSEEPTLYIWGWQSPLHFYSGLDSPTRHFFGDPLLEDYANGHHQTDPRVRPRVDRIARDLEAHPPGLVLVARPPFAALRGFLTNRGYRRTTLGGMSTTSADGLGLYVDADHFRAFERAGRRR